MSKDIISVITRAMNFNEDTMGAHTAQDILDSLTAAGYAVVPVEPTQEVYAALKRLTFAARTSGGTAGPDAELMAACEQAEAALAAALAGRP